MASRRRRAISTDASHRPYVDAVGGLRHQPCASCGRHASAFNSTRVGAGAPGCVACHQKPEPPDAPLPLCHTHTRMPGLPQPPQTHVCIALPRSSLAPQSHQAQRNEPRCGGTCALRVAFSTGYPWRCATLPANDPPRDIFELRHGRMRFNT